MFSTRTIAAISGFSLITAIAMTGHAQPRHRPKDADPDTDTDSDADTDTPKPKTKAKSKAKNVDPDADADADTETAKPKSKAKSKSKSKAKSKAKPKDSDADSDADAEAEAQRERDREQEKEREKEREKDAERERERTRAREKEQAAADADAANAKTKEKATATETELTANNGASGEAYQSGTLGFSIPITSVGAATGGGGEPVPAVDIVYFLDNKAALDLIVGVNVHHGGAAAATGTGTGTGATAGGGGSSTVIGAAAGLGYRMYSSKNGLAAFLEPQAVVTVPDVSNTNTLSINIGGLFGVERSLTPWFSISGAIGATVNLANQFKDIQLATAASLAANLYWR